MLPRALISAIDTDANRLMRRPQTRASHGANAGTGVVTKSLTRRGDAERARRCGRTANENAGDEPRHHRVLHWPALSGLRLGLHVLLRRDENVALPEAIAVGERDRRRLTLGEQLFHLGLVLAGEYRDRPDIGAVRLHLVGLLQEPERDARIVLQDARGLLHDKVADHRELGVVHQVGRALHEAVARAERLGPLEEAGARHAVVGEVRGEIIDVLRLAIGAREDDVDALGGSPRIAVRRRHEFSVVGDADEVNLFDGLAGARQEYVEDGQGAVELRAVQVAAHLAGDEVAVLEEGAQRGPDARKLGGHRAFAELRDVGDLARHFEARHQVILGAGEEGVGVHEVGAGEEVVERLAAVGQRDLRPLADLGELALLLIGPDAVERLGVFDPVPLLGERGERRIRRHRKAGQESGRIVWSCIGAAGRRGAHHDGKAQQQRKNPGEQHRVHSPLRVK